MSEITKIAVFKGNRIRKTIYKREWLFSVVDVVKALTDSVNPRDYWFKMKIRVKEEDGFEPSTVCRQLKLEAPDGKMRRDLAKTKRSPNREERWPETPEKNWSKKVARKSQPD